jgi:hypothetical protein
MGEFDMTSKFKRAVVAMALCALNLKMLTSTAYLQGQPANQRPPVKRAESRDQWYADGQRAVEQTKQLRANRDMRGMLSCLSATAWAFQRRRRRGFSKANCAVKAARKAH